MMFYATLPLLLFCLTIISADSASTGGDVDTVAVDPTGTTVPVEASENEGVSSSAAEKSNRSTTIQNETQQHHSPSSPTCGLYIATSTIPGAGYGIFTGVDRKEGDVVSDGDPLIPMPDVYYHLNNSPEPDLTSKSLDPTADYVWYGLEMGMFSESAHPRDQITAYAPGLDAAINCNLGLLNVDKLDSHYDDLGLHRSSDPGAGSFSPYYNATTVVTQPVPAGGELFKSYGDVWFSTRSKMFGLIPLRNDYPAAEMLAKSFDTKIEHELKHLSTDVRRDLWSLMINFKFPSRTINALKPAQYDILATIRNDGLRAVYQPNATLSLEHLQAHGRCVDGIQPGTSTLPQAGRGAFTKRSYKANEIVTGTPLLFVHSEDLFVMYDGDWENDHHLNDNPSHDFWGYQLLMNYAWHHPDAPALYLIPYGYEVQYINHNQTQANVRLEWAKDGIIMDHQNLEHSPSSMKDKASPGLFIDFVAIRDIQPGEELFFDYGDLWEAAWNEHVSNYPFREQKDYTSAREYNKKHLDAILRTDLEQSSLPYPDNLKIRCLNEVQESQNLTPERAVSLWTIDNPGVPCNVIARNVDDDGNVSYVVEYEAHWNDQDGQKHQEWMQSDWIVREAISFIDAPYTTDMFRKAAFRHSIGIPDDMMPDAWRGYTNADNE